jgi:hypothetical protein
METLAPDPECISGAAGVGAGLYCPEVLLEAPAGWIRGGLGPRRGLKLRKPSSAKVKRRPGEGALAWLCWCYCLQPVLWISSRTRRWVGRRQGNAHKQPSLCAQPCAPLVAGASRWKWQGLYPYMEGVRGRFSKYSSLPSLTDHPQPNAPALPSPLPPNNSNSTYSLNVKLTFQDLTLHYVIQVAQQQNADTS